MKRNALQCVKPETPKFIREFKEKVGYKEPSDPSTKHGSCRLAPDDDDYLNVNGDEAPVVCALAPGDMTTEEAEEYIGNNPDKTVAGVAFSAKVADAKKLQDGKVEFRKPAKRESGSAGLRSTTSASKQTRNDSNGSAAGTSSRGIKETRLLSFESE